MKYLTLQDLYAYFPELATSGPSDEALRLIIEDCERIVESDLSAYGFQPPFSDEHALSQVKRLVLFRTLADILPAPLSPHVNPQLAQYYEQKYRVELADLAKKPERMGSSPRTSQPDLPAFAKRKNSQESLPERVKRWFLF